jgi:regulatory protein YycI of two-component signal transduction system YycFG
MSNRPLTSISGITPRVEEFSRPYKGVEDQVMKYLVDAERERARKYLQRTYDPESIEFTSSQCQAHLNSQQVYIPVWKFEFTIDEIPFDRSDGNYSTYVSGWDTSTSGPVFYHPELSGGVAGVLTALASLVVLWPWNLLPAAAVGGLVFFIVRQVLSGLPRSQRMRAWGETTQQRIQDNAVGQQSTRQESGGYSGRQQQQQQRQQQRQRPTQTTSKYPTNDPQGLYKTLEVTPAATDSQIRDSFRRLARKYHPDMIQGSTAEKNAGKEKFQQISAAYDVLKDPRRRKEYDTYGTTSTRN